MEMVK